MKNIVHIFTGDALKEMLPKSIEGKQIIMRECLVDGPVTHSMNKDSLSDFFQIRSAFLSEHYELDVNYHEYAAPEINRIQQIQNGSTVYLWFEDDLFCQVNMWFVCLLLARKEALQISLVRPALAYPNNEFPSTLLQYGFGGLDTTLLCQAYKYAQPINEQVLNYFAQLWEAYSVKNTAELLAISSKLKPTQDFIPSAINACIGLWQNHPKQLLEEIISELKTDDFGKIFKAFNKRGAIYGFGDLQVKRIMESLADI